MSDQNFHEIQLSGKQLVFLFMCALVLTVVVFLFGVSVGRQFPSLDVESAQVLSAPVDVAAPAGTPEPTKTAANELSYAEALEGKAEDPSKATPPPPASDPAPAAAPPVAKAEEPEPPAPPTPEKKAAPAPAQKAAPTVSGWVVQVGAFNATDVAAREVTKLQGKGYPAFVFAEPEGVPGLRYKVRVGPYSARSEADRMLKDLTREGYKPFLKR